MVKLYCSLVLSLFAGILNAQVPDVDSLISVFPSAKDDSNKVIMCRMITGLLATSNTRLAIHYGITGVDLGKRIHFDKGIAGCYLNLSLTYSGLGKNDSALHYIDSALVYAVRVGDPNRIALCLINKANYYIDIGALDKAFKTCTEAIPYAEKSGNKDRHARVIMTQANIKYNQKEYAEAQSFYESIIPMFKEIHNMEMVGVCYMNVAICIKNRSDPTENKEGYKQAIAYHDLAIHIEDSIGSTERLITALSNRGANYRALAQYDKAFNDFNKAVQLSGEIGDVEQISYNMHSIGDMFLFQKKYDEALKYLIPAIDTARKYNLTDDESNAVESLSRLYREAGDMQKAYDYLSQYLVLKDTLLQRAQNEKLMQLQTAFEVDKKDQEIELLAKDKQLKENQFARQRLLSLFVVLLLITLIAIGILFFNRYRTKRKLRELEIRNKIAADLHDDIGSTLSSIRMYSEMVKTQPNTSLASQMLDKISANARESVESMSDIVWTINPNNDQLDNLFDRMQHYAEEMCSAANIELIMKKDESADVKIPMEKRRNIYLIFKEATNNAVKYSGGNKLEISLEQTNHQLKMEIADNGKGFDLSSINRGNGLDSMRHRAKEFDAEVKIESVLNKGTKIIFSARLP